MSALAPLSFSFAASDTDVIFEFNAKLRASFAKILLAGPSKAILNPKLANEALREKSTLTESTSVGAPDILNPGLV